MSLKPLRQEITLVDGCKVIFVDWEAWASRASDNMAKMLGAQCYLVAPRIAVQSSETTLPGLADWLAKQGAMRG